VRQNLQPEEVERIAAAARRSGIPAILRRTGRPQLSAK
jgi:hypothetical protein